MDNRGPLTVEEIVGTLERVSGWFDLDSSTWAGICCTGGGCDHPGMTVEPDPDREWRLLVSDGWGETIPGVHGPRGDAPLPRTLLVGSGWFDEDGDHLYSTIDSHEESLAAALAEHLASAGFRPLPMAERR